MIEPGDAPPLSATRSAATVETRITVMSGSEPALRYDRLATEEPLEIRLRAGDRTRTVAITMRTPGNDFELAAGFLHNEGVVARLAQVRGISYCLTTGDPAQQYNIVNVDLHGSELPVLDGLERHFTTTSACGVCGKANLEALHVRGLAALDDRSCVGAAVIAALPDRLRARQSVFEATGGLHAAAVFDLSGNLLAVREDVGRHNALDKVVGWALLGRRSLARSLLLVSGRSSYEIVQKALVARIPLVCSVSAPSSLAVELAREFGVTLVGFLRGSRFNIYAHPERIREAAP